MTVVYVYVLQCAYKITTKEMKLDIQACEWFFININDVPEYWYQWWQDKELHKGHFSNACLPRHEHNFFKKNDYM